MAASPAPIVRTPARLVGHWSDARLAARVADGDDTAAEILFGRHEPALRRYCHGLLSHSEDARDATQDTLERALVALRTSGPPRHLKAWLYRIAHNEAVALAGRRRENVVVPEDHPAPGHDVQGIVEQRADMADLLADLQALPERQRAALLMRELCGLSLVEIASALQITPEAAKTTISDARVGLQHQARGRSIDCDTIRSTLSANDGRQLRARTTRAHLQACAGCREFHGALRHRPHGLQALFPLPALVAITHGTSAGTGLQSLVRSVRRLVGQPSTAGPAAAGVAAALDLVVLVDAGPSRPAAAATPPERRTAQAPEPAATRAPEPRIPRSTPPQRNRRIRARTRPTPQATRPAVPAPSTPPVDRPAIRRPAAAPPPAVDPAEAPATDAAAETPMDCTAVVDGLPTPAPAAAALTPVIDIVKTLPVTVACQAAGAPPLPTVPALPITVPDLPDLPPLPIPTEAASAAADPVCAATAAPAPGTEAITAPTDLTINALCTNGRTSWHWTGPAS